MGLWDGHDAGVACVDAAGRVLFAAQEERFSRRKLDVGFPERSFAEAVAACGEPAEIVVSTSDPSKVLSRLVPAMGRGYYLFRRHKVPPRPLDGLRRAFKASFTQVPPLPGCAALTRRLVARRSGLDVPVRVVDHHFAHLASAFFTSGFTDATVLSLDGIGDGCSGAIARGDARGLEVLARIDGRDSIALLYEEATRMLWMRELEDEGKVMALAAFADLGAEEAGPLDDLVAVSTSPVPGVRVASGAAHRLRETLWRLGPERFAAAVQRMAERAVVAIARAAVEATGLPRLAVAGGLFSNVRINRLLRETVSSVGPIDLWVFPNMGDGGLALGAVLDRPAAIEPYLGTPVSAEAAVRIARGRGLAVREIGLAEVAAIIASGGTVGWVNGRMEYGPRALGARSILARPDDPRIRDRLNLAQKKRVFYQPFCPVMTRDEALRSLAGYDGREERWMTSLYGTTAGGARRLAGVTGPDGSCRPQILPPDAATPEERLFLAMVRAAEKETGIGALLNTSFNVHGDPIVRTGEDAIEALLASGLDALVVEGRIEIRRSGKA